MRLIKTRLYMAALAMAASLTLFSSVGRADLLSGCGSCEGNTFLLQYNPSNTTTSGPNTIYDVFLTINTAGFNNANTHFINSVAIKVSNSENTPPSSLVAAPGGIGVWTFGGGGLNANGCNGVGAGFVCAEDSNHAPVPNGTYTWEFHYATTDALMTGLNQASIKALYAENGNGSGNTAITSENITLQACGGTTGETCGGRAPG